MLARRLALLVLAVTPLTWGMCVAWFTPSEDGGHVASRCPCCAEEDVPPAPGPGGGDPCDGCGWKDAGRGVLPAEATPALPDAAPTAVVVLAAELALASPVDARETGVHVVGPPSERLEGVVLLN
jgi:hypothetical protein